MCFDCRLGFSASDQALHWPSKSTNPKRYPVSSMDFRQEILPEIIQPMRNSGDHVLQNVTLTLISLAVIPFYLLIAWRSANKLETGLSSFLRPVGRSFRPDAGRFGGD